MTLLKKIAAAGLSLTVTFSCLSLQVFAEEEPFVPQVIEGTYSYTSNEDENIQETDKFVYRDDCFMRSSFLGCEHLKLLSAQASIASASRYGMEEDIYERDYSDNGYNLKNMLKDMGFEDVSTNKYYTLEKLTDSAACAVGHRKISAYGKDYTLLAIIPRSAGYKQEWVGNFTVGTGDISAGFKSGRDEVLRYVKQYINDHNITGNIKVWITGHSRGSAIANMLGGFFAGGGIGYFDGKVSITPEDVYCYTFANPTTIKAGLAKSEELYVEGYRGGDYFVNDSPGEAWAPSVEGTVDPLDSIYGGIRNYPLNYDFITDLPFHSWGFTLYGNTLDITEGLSADDMSTELAVINHYCYEKFLKGDYRYFQEKDFDLLALDFVDSGNSGQESMEYAVHRLTSGLAAIVPTNQIYVESGYEAALQQLAGVYGTMLNVTKKKVDEDSSVLNKLIRPLLFSYLEYANIHLQAEGRASDQDDAVAIALEEIVSYFTGQSIDHSTFTVDQFVAMVSKYLADNESSELIKRLTSTVDKEVDSLIGIALKSALGLFCTKSDPTVSEAVMASIRACAYGADPASKAYETEKYREPAGARTVVYTMLKAAVTFSPKLHIDNFDELLGTDEKGNYNGSGSFKGLANGFLKIFMQDRDKDDNVIATYTTLAETADAFLIKALDEIYTDIFADMESAGFEAGFIQDAKNYLSGTKNNIAKIRTALMSILFYNGDDAAFSTAANIQNAATLIGNVDCVPPAHYNEVFVAWARTAVKAEEDSHYLEHVDAKEMTDTEDGNVEYWICHETDGDHYYKDGALTTEIPESEILIHDWNEPVYEWSEDHSTLTATRVCKHDAEHVETETVESTSSVYREATCTVNGQTQYTAEFENPVFEKTTVTVPDIPVLGHAWSDPVYTWSDDLSSVNAVCTCANDESHVRTETVRTSSEVTKQATMEEDGITTYTALFETEEFEDQVREEANISRIGTVKLSSTSFTYNGGLKKPSVIVKNSRGAKLKAGTDYELEFQDAGSCKAGTYAISVNFMGKYDGGKLLVYKIKKAPNTLNVNLQEKILSAETLQKKNQSFNIPVKSTIKATKRFKLLSVSSSAKDYISVSRTGKVTVKKGLKKGTYTIKVKVTAGGTTNYNYSTTTAKIKIIVK